MLRYLLSNRLFLGGLVFFLLFAGSCLYHLNNRNREGEQVKERSEETRESLSEGPLETPERVEVIEPSSQSKAGAEGGHFHEDGAWHGEPHTDLAPSPAEELNDPVAAAWARLDSISKHRHQWGDFSPRALELMAELTPTWDITSEGMGEAAIELLEELCELRDPRSAELLVSYQMDSSVNGRPPDEALVAMGPAAVPALVARLDDTAGETFLHILDLLPRIVEAHGSELGGIVEHIILPKLEAIAASEGDEGFTLDNRVYARKAIALIQKTGVQ